MATTNNLNPSRRLQKSQRRTIITARQRFVLGRLVENGGNGTPMTLGAIMVEAGYSPNTAKTPAKVTQSRGFLELLEEAMPDDELAQVHRGLLKSTRIEHMVFPLWNDAEADIPEEGDIPEELDRKRRRLATKGDTLSDDDITGLLAEVGCTVRKIVHGETARHVYYWAADTKARQDALKLAYDLKGRLNQKEPPAAGNTTYNTFIQQNNIDPNAPSARNIVNQTLESLMEATKRRAPSNERS